MMYHLKTTGATTRRIIEQLGHDKRTVALMFLAPSLLISLIWWVFSDNEKMFDIIGPALVGVFPFTVMFLVASITTLRERITGTLERLLAMPIGKFDIIFGYAIAFGLFGLVQSLITSSVAVYLLGLDIQSPQWFMIFVAVLDTFLGVALGLMVSAFARTEFQAAQFMPILIFPQFIVCGLFVPLDKLPDLLESIAHWLPLTYAVDALNGVTKYADISSDMWNDTWVMLAFSVGALLIAGLTLRRKTP
jgi:ABC transporter DrrB family efflux protein